MVDASQRASNFGFDVFFDASLNKLLNKHLIYQWFQSLMWHHWDGFAAKSREISKPQDIGSELSNRTAAEMPVKFQSDMTIPTPNLTCWCW